MKIELTKQVEALITEVSEKIGLEPQEFVNYFLFLYSYSCPDYVKCKKCGEIIGWSVLYDSTEFTIKCEKCGHVNEFGDEEEPARKSIGERIAEIRKKKEISLRKLEELTGLGYANLCRIEKGKYSVGIDILERICEALDVEIKIVG